ncbi:MAG: thioredoxin [Clostridia bacterium]|nr:thioredoxin [Clostridia bacterium]
MEIKHLNDENFEEETNKSNLVVVDFFATWCGPCRILGPILENVADEVKDVDIFKVDVDENEETAKNFGVMSIPTVVLLRDGKEVARNVGLMNYDNLLDFINQHK